MSQITKVIGIGEDGEIISGSVRELAERFGYSESLMRKRTIKEEFDLRDISNGKLYHIKRVTSTELREMTMQKVAIPVKYIEKESEIDRVARLLRTYGNTNYSKKPTRIILELEKRGMKVTYRPMMTNRRHYILYYVGDYY